MADDRKTTVSLEKYGQVNRSILRNLLVSMLAFGLAVGLIFPFSRGLYWAPKMRWHSPSF